VDEYSSVLLDGPQTFVSSGDAMVLRTTD